MKDQNPSSKTRLVDLIYQAESSMMQAEPRPDFKIIPLSQELQEVIRAKRTALETSFQQTRRMVQEVRDRRKALDQAIALVLGQVTPEGYKPEDGCILADEQYAVFDPL